jgi:hypothetical protein
LNFWNWIRFLLNPFVEFAEIGNKSNCSIFFDIRKVGVASDQHREMHCATAKVCAKEVLTVTECCPLQVEQCFHEVINWGPDVS